MDHGHSSRVRTRSAVILRSVWSRWTLRTTTLRSPLHTRSQEVRHTLSLARCVRRQRTTHHSLASRAACCRSTCVDFVDTLQPTQLFSSSNAPRPVRATSFHHAPITLPPHHRSPWQVATDRVHTDNERRYWSHNTPVGRRMRFDACATITYDTISSPTSSTGQASLSLLQAARQREEEIRAHVRVVSQSDARQEVDTCRLSRNR